MHSKKIYLNCREVEIKEDGLLMVTVQRGWEDDGDAIGGDWKVVKFQNAERY